MTNTDYLNPIALILTVIFGIASIYFYLKSRSIKKTAFIYATNILQTKAHPKVSIRFEKRQIENLTKAIVLFYNAGNREIRYEDIPSSGYPTIVFSELSHILSSTVLALSNNSTSFEANQKQKNIIELTFQYLNPQDGAVIEILYEEESNAKIPSVTFHATLIGATQPDISKYINRPKLKDYGFHLFIGLIALILGVIVLITFSKGDTLGLVLAVFNIFAGIANILAAVLKFPRRIPGFARAFFQ